MCSVDEGGGQVGQNDSNNQTVQTKSLSEDENKNDSDVDVLLGVGTDTSITSNTDRETSSKGGQTAAKTWGKMSVTIVGTVVPCTSCDGIQGSLDN